MFIWLLLPPILEPPDLVGTAAGAESTLFFKLILGTIDDFPVPAGDAGTTDMIEITGCERAEFKILKQRAGA